MYKAHVSDSNPEQFFGQKTRLVFVVVVLVFGSITASAQQSAACVPNTVNYPCVYVANSDDDTVVVINATTNKVIGTIQVGGSPQGLAITPDNRFVYVALGIDNAIAVIDTAAGKTAGTPIGLSSGSSPSQIAVPPDGTVVFVLKNNAATGVSSVDQVDLASGSTKSLDFISFPSAIAVGTKPSTLYVADICNDSRCVEMVDTAGATPIVSNQPFETIDSLVVSSTAVVCFSGLDRKQQVQVSCIYPGQDQVPQFVSGFLQSSPYGLAMAPDGLLYLVDPTPSDAPQNNLQVIDSSGGDLRPRAQLILGNGPTGVAIGPGAQSVYVTNANDSTVSIINTATNDVATLSNTDGFFTPKGIVAMTAAPPQIDSQPASQTISTGQSVTLTVSATSPAPASYQWFQGLTGDTSIPLEGGLGSSFTTPPLSSTTSYWVAITNVAGTVSSDTATITVTTSQPPTCTLSVAGNGSSTFTDPLTVVATATCLDPQGQSLTTSIDFGDGNTSTGSNSGVFTATHTYNAPTQGQTEETFPIFVEATNTSQLQSPKVDYSWILVGTELAPPVFAGQSSSVTLQLSSPTGQPELVTFVCTTVTTTTGSTPIPASDVGISCGANPSPVELTATPQPVTIVIQTTGSASAALPNTKPGAWPSALWMPIPAIVLLAIGVMTLRSPRRRFSLGFALSGLFAMSLLTVSCGGGFTAPNVVKATPAGNYQITVIDVPVGSNSGFEQTSLIVPLTVSPFQ